MPNPNAEASWDTELGRQSNRRAEVLGSTIFASQLVREPGLETVSGAFFRANRREEKSGVLESTEVVFQRGVAVVLPRWLEHLPAESQPLPFERVSAEYNRLRTNPTPIGDEHGELYAAPGCSSAMWRRQMNTYAQVVEAWTRRGRSDGWGRLSSASLSSATKPRRRASFQFVCGNQDMFQATVPRAAPADLSYTQYGRAEKLAGLRTLQSLDLRSTHVTGLRRVGGRSASRWTSAT